MTLRCLDDRVVIRRDETQTVSEGGIELPGTIKANRGVIVAAGPGHLQQDGTRRGLVVEVGDRVLFGPYAGSLTVEVEGETLLVMYENEIFAVID